MMSDSEKSLFIDVERLFQFEEFFSKTFEMMPKTFFHTLTCFAAAGFNITRRVSSLSKENSFYIVLARRAVVLMLKILNWFQKAHSDIAFDIKARRRHWIELSVLLCAFKGWKSEGGNFPRGVKLGHEIIDQKHFQTWVLIFVQVVHPLIFLNQNIPEVFH